MGKASIVQAQIMQPKGNSVRDMPLSDDAVAVLAVIRELPYPYRRRTRQGYIVGVDRSTISDWVHTAGTVAGLDRRKTHSHILRASFVADALMADGDVRSVQKLLGHSSSRQPCDTSR